MKVDPPPRITPSEPPTFRLWTSTFWTVADPVRSPVPKPEGKVAGSTIVRSWIVVGLLWTLRTTLLVRFAVVLTRVASTPGPRPAPAISSGSVPVEAAPPVVSMVRPVSITMLSGVPSLALVVSAASRLAGAVLPAGHAAKLVFGRQKVVADAGAANASAATTTAIAIHQQVRSLIPLPR